MVDLTKFIDNGLGLNDKPRYKTWPERLIGDALTAPGEILKSETPVTSEQLIKPAMDISGLVGVGSIPNVAVSGLEKNALGIVPVAKAKELKIKSGEPSDILKSAVENTPGAAIDENGHLILSVTRNQRPEQELSPSVRGGVFYLPKGSKDAKYYSGTKENFAYGGNQNVKGETAFKNPLVVKGATGGKAPENAYLELMGADAFKNLNSDVARSVGAHYLSYEDKVQLVREFMEKHAPEMADYAEHIVDNSKKGNQLRYALQEAAVASAVRKAGYDGVIGYSELRGANKGKQRISEVYDVREDSYPSPYGGYSIHPELYSSPIVVPVQHDPFKTTPVDFNPFTNPNAS